LRDREIYPDVGWQSPSGGSRPVPIGSRSIGVSLQPAIPWRVAPQQSPSPLHRSPILITHLCSGAQSNALLDLTATAQTSPRSHWTGPNIEAMPMRSAPRPRSVISTLRARCHFYLAPTVDLNATTSLFTHSEWAAFGEQMTIRARDCSMASRITSPRSAAPESSSRSRKTGVRRLGTKPSVVCLPISCLGIRYVSRARISHWPHFWSRWL